MQVNITIIGDNPNYLTDPAVTLGLALNDLGCETFLSQNHISDKHKNVMLGCHNLPDEYAVGFKERGLSWVAWQLEQLHDGNERSVDSFGALRHADIVYDYDEGNLEILEELGIIADLMPVGYHPGLRPEVEFEKEVDVFMAGCWRHRRKEIVDRLDGVHFAGVRNPVFGQDLVEAVARSRVCLNIHHSGVNDPQEQARITPLLAQGACVVSETSPHNIYGDGIVEARYGDLVDAVNELLKDEERMAKQRILGLDAVKNIDMKEIVKGGIGAYCTN